jgi:hypothetical protein
MALRDNRNGGWWWAENMLVDHGVPAYIGLAAWTTYTCILRHASQENTAFPSAVLLMAETGLSNRGVYLALKKLKEVGLILVDRSEHQHNVYSICSGEIAVKKAKLKKLSGTVLRGVQTNSVHVADELSSPEQTNSVRPKKNQLKRTKEKDFAASLPAGKPAAKKQGTEVVIPSAIRTRLQEIVVFWHYDGQEAPSATGAWSQINKSVNEIWTNFGGDLAKIEAANEKMKKHPNYGGFHNYSFPKIADTLWTVAPKSVVTTNPQNDSEAPSRTLQRQTEALLAKWEDAKLTFGTEEDLTLADLEHHVSYRNLIAMLKQDEVAWKQVQADFDEGG